MKRIALCLALSALLLAGGCAQTSTTTTPSTDAGETVSATTAAPETTTAAPSQNGEGTLGDYGVKITGFSLSKDYDGKDAIIINYDFTNNSEEAVAALFALNFKLFQGGVELETAIMVDDCDLTPEQSEIKKGVTLSCQSAYLLRDTSSPVEIEVSELMSFSDEKIVTEFNITK